MDISVLFVRLFGVVIIVVIMIMIIDATTADRRSHEPASDAGWARYSEQKTANRVNALCCPRF